MAVDFNGTTSKAEHTTAGSLNNALVTICVWAFADGMGEGNIGTIMCLDESANPIRPRLRHTNVANDLTFVHQFSTSGATWTFPATDGQWNAISLTYDRGSILNDPTARVNFSDVTVTETGAPIGTANAPATGYCVGNIGGQTTTWDGGLAHLQIFNRILSTAEQDQVLQFPGSVTSGLELWLPLYNSTYNLDLSSLAQNATLTAIGSREPGPSLEDYWKSQQWDGFNMHAGLRM